ncbi:7030_t:CDS:1, partial [Racocetra persica]
LAVPITLFPTISTSTPILALPSQAAPNVANNPLSISNFLKPIEIPNTTLLNKINKILVIEIL